MLWCAHAEYSNVKTSPIVGGTVLTLLVLLLALCAVTVVVCRRMKLSRTIIKLHNTSETRLLLETRLHLDSGRKSHSELLWSYLYVIIAHDFMHMKYSTLSRR